MLGIEVEAEASGVGGNLKITGRHLNEDQPLWGFSRSLRIRVRTVPRPGSLGIGAAHPITPNLSVFIDYRYTALGPEWAHGRQIDITRGDLRNPMYVSSGTCANWKFDLGM